MPEKLRPCPFCGGEADAGFVDGEWIVECQDCNTTIFRDTPAKAMALWQRRPREEELARLLEVALDAMRAVYDAHAQPHLQRKGGASTTATLGPAIQAIAAALKEE